MCNTTLSTAERGEKMLPGSAKEKMAVDVTWQEKNARKCIRITNRLNIDAGRSSNQEQLIMAR